jgi:hypothetical protein
MPVEDVWEKARWRLYEIPQKFSGQTICSPRARKRPYPGVETPATPDEPDVLDAGGGLEGFGGMAWRRVRRLCRVVWWFVVVSGDLNPAMDAMN